MSNVADFGEPFQRISIEQAKKMIEDGNVQLVDVRQPNEYQQGHIPGAVLVPLDKLMKRASELAEDKDIVFICAVGERSAVASEIAATVGRTRVFNLEGGTNGWARRGYPLEK